MAARLTFQDRIRLVERMPTTREACLTDMMNKSSQMTIPHCPPEWDLYSEMCWEPTPAGEEAILPCPDDGFLNAQQYATRLCLPDASWHINDTFNDKPYTNFDDCFLPHDPTAEDDLKKLVDTKVIFILKSMDEYNRVYLAIHVVSIVLLVASTVLSATGVFKLRQKNYSTFSYIALTVASAALLTSNIVSVSVSAVDDATKVLKCRVAKSLVLLSNLVFYEFLLLYMYMCIVPVIRATIRPLLIKTTIAATVAVTVLLVMAELLFETFSCPNKFCGFRTLQSPFHWLTTAPKLLLIMTHTCLGSVTVFGVLLLKHPQLCKESELCHIRQKSLSVFALVLYNVVHEILLVLIHTEAYMSYSDLPVDEYLNAFSFVTAAQGIIFSVVMCFLDFGLLAMLRLSYNCCQPDIPPASERDLKTYEAHPMSQNSSNVDNTHGIEYQTFPQTVVISAEHSKAEQAIRQEDQQHCLYESKLMYGFLK